MAIVLSNPVSDYLRSFRHRLSRWTQAYPVLVAVGILLLYLALLQRHFFFSGDTWAEAYTEYLNKTLGGGWSVVTDPSWEGYVTFLPSLLTKVYVALHRPLGLIDYYDRYVAITFAVGSFAFIAAKINRKVIRSDGLRIGLAVVFLLLLTHLSSFSFINVWYVGFIPIILLSINPALLSRKRQLTYLLYALAVIFTKPSTVLIPFVLYRGWKTKEYISNGILLLAILLQTYLLLFASEGVPRTVSHGAGRILEAIYYGAGVGFLKLFSIAPTHGWYVTVADLLVIGIFAAVFYFKRWLLGVLFLGSYLFSIYSNLLAPDVSTVFQAQLIYANNSKLQRELLTNLLLILPALLLIPHIVASIRARGDRYARHYLGLLLILGLLLVARLYHTIDTTSSSVSVDISSFRQDLNTKVPVCLPVAPTPTWSPGTNWYLQYMGGCRSYNFERMPDLASFKQPLVNPYSFIIPTPSPESLKTVILLVRNANNQGAILTLTDQESGITYTSFVKGGSPDHLRFVDFNVSGMPVRSSYSFSVTSSGAPLFLGRFKDTDIPTYYNYSVGIPIPGVTTPGQ